MRRTSLAIPSLFFASIFQGPRRLERDPCHQEVLIPLRSVIACNARASTIHKLLFARFNTADIANFAQDDLNLRLVLSIVVSVCPQGRACGRHKDLVQLTVKSRYGPTAGGKKPRDNDHKISPSQVRSTPILQCESFSQHFSQNLIN